MKVIGLCGGSGSGKGTVCDVFREHNIPSVDTDAVYREITAIPGPCLDALESEFGSEIITDEGGLNRKTLAAIVFSGDDSTKRLSRLNEIAHRFILDETRRRLEVFRQNGSIAAVVDAPVLFESGFDKECGLVVCVIADRETRIQRIIARDGITRKQAEERINSQLSNEELISRSDFVINNNSDIHSLRNEVSSFLAQIFDN